jgi:hypothetical protein
MAQLVVRNLEDTVKRRLKARAEAHGRSLEGEVREILRSVAEGKFGAVYSHSEQGFAEQVIRNFSGVAGELKIPPRSKELPRGAKFRR